MSAELIYSFLSSSAQAKILSSLLSFKAAALLGKMPTERINVNDKITDIIPKNFIFIANPQEISNVFRLM